MPDPKPVEKQKQLVVEGNDMRVFFRALLNHLHLDDIQIQNSRGVTELRPFLRALSNVHGFHQVDVLAVVRDADNSPSSAFQSVADALQCVGFARPTEPLRLVGDRPKVAALILPDSETSGMLEDLCLRSVQADPRMECLDGYFDCIEKADCLPSNVAKARAHAFLASCRKPGLRVGEAAKAGYWPLDNPAFDPVKTFLHAL